MSLRVLYSHMYVQHVFLVGFVVIVVIILTLWMLRYRCSYMWKSLITLRSEVQWREKAYGRITAMKLV
jgi:quinol-cytochrome oxidoreductase complex cytochrome b subunit